MSDLEFAIAIVFPGAGVAEIVKGATYNGVHIIDKEDYNPGKDYTAYRTLYEPYIDGKRILLLFVFPDGQSILASTDAELARAIEKTKEQGTVLPDGDGE